MATPSAGSAATAFGRALVAARKQRRKPRAIWGCKGSLAIAEGLAIKVSSVPTRPMSHVARAPHDRGRTLGVARPGPDSRSFRRGRRDVPMGTSDDTQSEASPCQHRQTSGDAGDEGLACAQPICNARTGCSEWRRRSGGPLAGGNGNLRQCPPTRFVPLLSFCSRPPSSADAERTIPPDRTSRRLRP